MNQPNNIKPAIKLSLVNSVSSSRAVLGRGVVELLLNVERDGSLNKAAKDMKMSYSKAWKLITRTEETLGIKLLIKKRPSGSKLTTDGKKLATVYLDLFDKLQKNAEDQFQKLMIN